MPSLTFALCIPPEEFQRYYGGNGKTVLAIADDGRRLVFPASHLAKFVSHNGVHGHFKIEFDENSRFVRMIRLT